MRKSPSQVNADLVHYRIERYLGGQFLERRQYESLDELIQNELAELDFDDLVSVSDEELESISTTPEQDSDDYRLLSRLKDDCDYFLGVGGRAEKAPVGWERAGTDRKNAGTLCCPAR